MDRARLLFVTTDFPFPPRFGVTNKTANLLRRLGGRHEVSLLSFYDRESPPTEADLAVARRHCRRVLVVPRRERNAAAAILRGQPPFTSRYASPEAARLLRELTTEHRFDVVHFDCLGTLPLLDALAEPDALTVASVNDVYTLMLLGLRRAGPTGRVVDALPRALVRRFERRWYARFDQVHFVSEVDVSFCRRLVPGAPAMCVPLGVEAESLPDYGREREEGDTLVYLANMAEGHGASILDFVRRTLPLIRRRVPSTRLLVVGANPPAELIARAKADPGLEVTGWVDDVHEQLARGAVALSLNPLVGGMQTKVLESMAVGKAVVGLPHNFTAITGAVEGEHFLSGRGPIELADRVVSLLRNPERRRAIGHAARTLVRTRYSWERVVERYLELVTRPGVRGARGNGRSSGAPRPAQVDC